ncbi:serine palmitoyltransferase small subunit A-like [Convolutriloba macropyga]|uniref:serine palmitoyltransferase small subunit A-like n=1 Tax=Convolutriloba macropyga TaxID=536237 RepID=UPI003F526F4C
MSSGSMSSPASPVPTGRYNPPCCSAAIKTTVDPSEDIFAKLKLPGWRGRFNRFYFSMLIHTTMLIMEPWEARLFTSVMMCILLMSLYTFFVYFPPYVLQMLQYVRVV